MRITKSVTAKKDVTVKKSTLNAKNDTKVTSNTGAVNIKDNSKILADRNVEVNSYKTITFGKKDDSDVTIDNTASIVAGNNLKFICKVNRDKRRRVINYYY